MNTMILAPIVLCVLGIVFGAILAVAAKVFAVEKDPREEAIVECLPGANCGGCGYPGCSGYAAAIVAGTAPVNACSPGGADVANEIGKIMGVEVEVGARKIAQVMCTGGGHNKTRYDYVGLESCLYLWGGFPPAPSSVPMDVWAAATAWRPVSSTPSTWWTAWPKWTLKVRSLRRLRGCLPQEHHPHRAPQLQEVHRDPLRFP